MLSGSGYSKQRAAVLQRPDGFIAADIANFHTQRPFVGADTAIPEVFGLLAVDDHIPALLWSMAHFPMTVY